MGLITKFNYMTSIIVGNEVEYAEPTMIELLYKADNSKTITISDYKLWCKETEKIVLLLRDLTVEMKMKSGVDTTMPRIFDNIK